MEFEKNTGRRMKEFPYILSRSEEEGKKIISFFLETFPNVCNNRGLEGNSVGGFYFIKLSTSGTSSIYVTSMKPEKYYTLDEIQFLYNIEKILE